MGGLKISVTGDDLNKLSCVASCIAYRIYDIILDVGHGKPSKAF